MTEQNEAARDKLVEAVRAAMIKADGDDCDKERAAFYLDQLQREGLFVSLSAALADQPRDDVREDYESAKKAALALAWAIHDKHFKDKASGWTPLDDLTGLILQIDNMTTVYDTALSQTDDQPDKPAESDLAEQSDNHEAKNALSSILRALAQDPRHD